MTFRTFEIDAGHAASTATNVTASTRNIRSRRRALTLSRRTGGCRVAGFGF